MRIKLIRRGKLVGVVQRDFHNKEEPKLNLWAELELPIVEV
jgi:hypothetical protein